MSAVLSQEETCPAPISSGHKRTGSFLPQIGILARSSRAKPFLAICDQALVSGGNFLSLVLLARSTSASDVGLYVLTLRVLELLSELLNVLVWSPYTILSARRDSRALATYKGSVLLQQVALSGCVGLVIAFSGFAAWSFSVIDERVFRVALLLGPAGFFISGREFVRRIAIADMQMHVALAVDAGAVTLQVVSLAVLHRLASMHSTAVLCVAALSCGISCCIYLWLFRGRFHLNRAEARADFAENFAIGKWLLGGNAAQLASFQIYPWFLALTHGAAAAGILAACDAIINFGRMLLVSAQNYLGAKASHVFATGGKQALKVLTLRWTYILVSALLLFTVLMVVAGNDVASLVYGPRLAGQGGVLAFLSVALLLNAASIAPTYSLSIMNGASSNFRVNLAALAMHVTVGIWLTGALGAKGAALGLAVGTIVAGVLRWGVFCKVVCNRSIKETS